MIDTNVLHAAEGLAGQASRLCRANCIEALDAIRTSGVYVIDTSGEVLSEYENKLTAAHQNSGRRFLMHVYVTQHDSTRCHRVAITPSAARVFEEFPDHAGLANFDRSDRKFVAVALAHADRPRILEALDSDFWNARSTLEDCGVRVEFLCGNIG